MSEVLLLFPDAPLEVAVSEIVGSQSVTSFAEAEGLDDLPGLCRRLIAPDTEVVAVGPLLSEDDALTLIRELDRHHPSVTVILAQKPNAALWQDALRAGARDIIDPAGDRASLADALERAGDLSRARRKSIRIDTVAGIASEESGRTIVITSPKGGSGKTVVATNLAVALASSAPGEVVLVDLDLQFGDVASALGLNPKYTIYTATQASGNEASLLKAFLTPHPSQLLVLCAPEEPTEADDVKEGDAVRIVLELSKLFRWVIVDTGAGLDDMTLSMAEVATDLVFVSSTDVMSVRGVRKESTIMNQLGVRATRHLVLNRCDAKVGLSPKDISETIGLPISALVPSSRSVPTSMNIGVPVVENEPRGLVARGINAFAGSLRESDGSVPAAKSWRSFLR